MQVYQWAKTRAEQLAFEMGDKLGLKVPRHQFDACSMRAQAVKTHPDALH